VRLKDAPILDKEGCDNGLKEMAAVLGIEPPVDGFLGSLLEHHDLDPIDNLEDDRDSDVSDLASSESSLSEASDDEPAAAASELLPRPFPAGPHDLATINEWGSGFTVDELIAGLPELDLKYDCDYSVTITVGGSLVKLGTIYPQGRELLRAQCNCKHVDPLKARCRITVRYSSICINSLREAEAQLVRWFIAGHVLTGQSHTDLGKSITDARKITAK
jgi:hypothetical protein